MKKEITIREATTEDLTDLAEISRTTWEGHDYLEQVSENWLKQQGFFVGEINGRVIACGKLTTLPGEIAWLEGLRVHTNFKGKGYGKKLANEILRIAKARVDQGLLKTIQFSTYISNAQSISIAENQGFRADEHFHVISMENPPVIKHPVTLTKFIPTAKDFSIYPGHAPCGWKYINYNCEDSLEWMQKNAEFWQVETGAKFLTANRGTEISPLTAAMNDTQGFIQGILALAEKKRLDYLEMMIHDSHTNILATAIENGFSYWDEQGVANLSVYKFLL